MCTGLGVEIPVYGGARVRDCFFKKMKIKSGGGTPCDFLTHPLSNLGAPRLRAASYRSPRCTLSAEGVRYYQSSLLPLMTA